VLPLCLVNKVEYNGVDACQQCVPGTMRLTGGSGAARQYGPTVRRCAALTSRDVAGSRLCRRERRGCNHRAEIEPRTNPATQRR